MNKVNSTIKIALIGDCLAKGGAEKVHATLSVFFAKKGFSAYNVIFIDDIMYSYSGELLNLGKLKSKTIYQKLKRIYVLRQYLRKNKFDFIIDFRYRVNTIQELLISHFAYPISAIYTVHSGIITNYIPKRKCIAKLIYSRHQLVTVSKAIETLVRHIYNLNVTTIYNPFDIDKIQELSTLFIPSENNYILAVGRMNEKVKQFDKLIEAYEASILSKKNIKLLILGSGKNQNDLKILVNQKQLTEKVIFKVHQNNPHPFQKNALFSVLSSSNEGLPNVLIESLITKTPVISFDCFAGPNEIITNKFNGLLVENQSIEKLTEAMNLLIEDEKLYWHCKQNAFQSATPFSVAVIGQQWLNFLKIGE